MKLQIPPKEYGRVAQQSHSARIVRVCAAHPADRRGGAQPTGVGEGVVCRPGAVSVRRPRSPPARNMQCYQRYRLSSRCTRMTVCVSHGQDFFLLRLGSLVNLSNSRLRRLLNFLLGTAHLILHT